MNYNLSVIVPVFNTAVYLEECIESIQKQTLKNIQIILVDDESPDRAGEICDSYAQEFDNIKVIHKKNGGLGFARNSGLSLANGEYVAFLDSDDYVDIDFYEHLVEKAKKEDADICYSGGYKQFDKTGVKIFKFGNLENQIIEGDLKVAMPRLISRTPDSDDLLPGSAWMGVYKTTFLKSNGIKFISEREFISEDVWFNMDCFKSANKVIYVHDVIGNNYRYNADSLSRGYNSKRFDILYRSIEKLIDRCETEKLSNYYGRIALYFWVNFEKCVNQEVRFNQENALFAIRKMSNMPLCNELIKYLSNKELNGRMHTLLCKLLAYKKYYLIIMLLKIYNWKEHT